jgi:hypothetical protein
MYTYGEIIYGSPVGIKADKWLNSDENDRDDWEDIGFTISYSGSSERVVAYIGVKLGEIDAATDAVGIDVQGGRMVYGSTIDEAKWFSLVPTSEQKAETERLFAALPKKLQEVMPPLGVYLVWSTS